MGSAPENPHARDAPKALKNARLATYGGVLLLVTALATNHMYSIIAVVALAVGITAFVLILFGMMQIGLYIKGTTEMSRADLLAGTWGTVAWVLLPGLGLLIGAHGLAYLLMGRLNEEQEIGPAGRVLGVIVIAVMTIQIYVGILLFVHFGRVES